MNIKARLAKLEQRLRSVVDLRLLTDEQLNDRLRELLGITFDTDLSHCSQGELDEYADEFLRQVIIQESGQQCHDWPRDRLLSEAGRLVRGMTA